jgi:tripartite-type tricarboxylate transporter receptor subunit TctC
MTCEGVPRGTPSQVIAQLENAIRATTSSAEFVSAAEKLAVRPAFLPAQEFSVLVSKEDAELSRLLQAIGLKKQP